MLGTLFAGFALLGAAAAAAAQPGTAPPAPAHAPDPAALAEARELLRAMHFEETFDATMSQTTDSTFTTVMAEMERQYGRDFPDDLEARIRRLLRENMERLADDMRPTALEDSARVYARYFTVEELRQLRQFQTHPVMVKFQGIAPQFMNELMQIGVAASARRLPGLIEQMRREIDAWELEQQRQPAPTG